MHSDWLSPPLTLTALPPLTVTLVLAELCQTITTDSRHSMCKHRALVRVSCSLGRLMGQRLPVGKLMSRS